MPTKPSDLRNVLVAVSGQTPAIITETLWALEKQLATRVDEIRIVTTIQGCRIIESRLLGIDGEFSRFCSDYGIPAGRIAFSGKSIHVLKDSRGNDLEDIRTSQDNIDAADQVFNLIREWCKRADEHLLCSVAGGRKTLGIYLTMSLMMFGRPADKLYHVLVTPAFESGVPDFYYPPPENRFYKFIGKEGAHQGASGRISSDEAKVELAEIPFLRLRDFIGSGIHPEKGFTEAVTETQRLMNHLQAPPMAVLELKTCRLKIGHFEINLSRQLTAVYAFFLLEFNGPRAGAIMDLLFEKRQLLANLERQIDRFKKAELEKYAWQRMSDLDDFRDRIGPCISKVNKTIRRTLGSLLAPSYSIKTGGKYGVNVQHFKVLGESGRPWKGLR